MPLTASLLLFASSELRQERNSKVLLLSPCHRGDGHLAGLGWYHRPAGLAVQQQAGMKFSLKLA